jgi:hypothetical protein
MRYYFNILLIITLLLTGTDLFSQSYNMNNTSETTCSGTFYDSGGSGGSYGNNQSFTKTFTSSNTGQCLRFAFSSFSTESGFDYLYIYDGTSTAAPLIGYYSGTSSPGTVTGTSGSLTFYFYSDGNTTSSGWAATISCVSCNNNPSYWMWSNNATTNMCAGTIYDDRGPSANYLWNRDEQFTINTGTGTSITMTFSSFDLESHSSCGYDYLQIYNNSTLIGKYCGTASPGTVTASSGILKLVFHSDGGVERPGFAASWTSTVANAGSITGPTAACPGQTGMVYSISAVNNASTYTWSVPTGATITSGQGTTSITVTWGTSAGSVSVTPSSRCGVNGGANSKSVVMNTTSDITGASVSATPSAICNGNSTNLSLSGGSLGTGATWKWYSGSCGGTFVATGSNISASPSSNTTYYVRAEGTCNNTACLNVSVSVAGSGPTISNAGPDQYICASTSVTMAGNNPSVGTGTWTQISGPNTPNISNVNSYNTVIGSTTALISGVYVFRWTIANICDSNYDDVVIFKQ